MLLSCLNGAGYSFLLLCRNLLISRYIEIIADIFRVMVDIFEKSLIYLAEHPPWYPHPAKTNPQNKKAPCTAGRFFNLLTDRTFHLKLD